MSRRKFDPYQQVLGVASAWLVAVLAVIAALIVRDFSPQNPLVRWGWWILVGVAILRALYRSHIYRKRMKLAHSKQAQAELARSKQAHSKQAHAGQAHSGQAHSKQAHAGQAEERDHGHPA